MFSTLRHAIHLFAVGYVMMREGVVALASPQTAPPEARPFLAFARLVARKDAGARGARIVAALSRLGPSYVKLGQFLATRPDLVGIGLARDLEALQDRLPAFDLATARETVATALEQPVEAVFAAFSPAVAAASIAQVHKAQVETAEGARTVAVKVLRPGVKARFRRDINAQAFMARLMERFFPATRRLRPTDVVKTLERSVLLEMDLRFEAAALSEMAQNTKDDPGFRVPKVDWERTAADVLTLEWVDGIPLSDKAGLEAAGLDLPRLGQNVIQSFLRHALRDGFFHADMHPGNLFAERDGTLVAVDFGIMGRTGPKERRFLAEILYGFITRDYRRVAQVHFDAGYVPPHHTVEEFAQAIRAIGEPIHDRTADQISMAKLLTLLFEITDLFDMRTRTELVMLQKTMVVVEGVARGLDPKLDMWKTADPVVREWIERNLGPIGIAQDLGREARELFRIAGRLPELAARAEAAVDALEKAGREGLPLSPESVAAIGRAEGRGNRWLALGVWALVALLAYGVMG